MKSQAFNLEISSKRKHQLELRIEELEEKEKLSNEIIDKVNEKIAKLFEIVLNAENKKNKIAVSSR